MRKTPAHYYSWQLNNDGPCHGPSLAKRNRTARLRTPKHWAKLYDCWNYSSVTRIVSCISHCLLHLGLLKPDQSHLSFCACNHHEVHACMRVRTLCCKVCCTDVQWIDPARCDWYADRTLMRHEWIYSPWHWHTDKSRQNTDLNYCFAIGHGLFSLL